LAFNYWPKKTSQGEFNGMMKRPQTNKDTHSGQD
jgi:hypothetical protein